MNFTIRTYRINGDSDDLSATISLQNPGITNGTASITNVEVQDQCFRKSILFIILLTASQFG
ncbi:MAG: hypothetical protein CM1200mP10_23760 [Candidatus Neomarinimicrobiota bacterium]|nr:MAG: hypothetical protein CM1200mP10_23760 [Candidatus Neomarinimicrobiota bacterium]